MPLKSITLENNRANRKAGVGVSAARVNFATC